MFQLETEDRRPVLCLRSDVVVHHSHGVKGGRGLLEGGLLDSLPVSWDPWDPIGVKRGDPIGDSAMGDRGEGKKRGRIVWDIISNQRCDHCRGERR